MTTTREIIDELNVLLKLDKEAVTKLLLTEVPIHISPKTQIEETAGLLIHTSKVDEELEDQYISVHRLLHYCGIHILVDRQDGVGKIAEVTEIVDEDAFNEILDAFMDPADENH